LKKGFVMLPSTTGSTPVAASAAPAPQGTVRAQPPSAAGADAATVANAPEQRAAAPAEVEKALKTLNEFTAMVARDVRFTMDEESGKTIVKVVDTATEEVLRQFPSEEALSIAHSIDKMQGLLIREKA
jgi:flagellar protein FlaG